MSWCRGSERSLLKATADPHEAAEDGRFIDCVKAGREAGVPCGEGVKAPEVTLSAVKSAVEGRRVRLPLMLY